MKKPYVILSTILLIALSFAFVLPANAENITKTFTLRHFDATLTFPKSASPGDSILISVNAVAKTSIRVRDLSIQILAYMEGGDLQSISSTSLASDLYVNKGNTIHKEFSITVPTTIPRGALVTVISEITRTTGYTYYYPAYYYYWYYPDYTGPYWYYPYYYAYYYPQTYYQEYVESKTLPGTYILATTPEYTELKSNYDKLSSEFDTLSTEYNDLSAKYQQATEQNKELSDKLSAITQDLNNAKIVAYVFVAATVILAIIAAYLLYTRRKTAVTPAVVTPTPGAVPPTQPEKIAPPPEKKEIQKTAPQS